MTKSDHSWQLLKQYTPNGSQTLSKMPNRYVENVYPKVLESGFDGHVYDVDGNLYIDLISGLGAISVGYTDVEINQAAKAQIEKGVAFSLPTDLEWQVAKRLTELVPSTEQWKFTKTGSDATTMAVKCARAFTKRNKIFVCGYHGWHDWFSVVNDKRAGIPNFNEEYVTRGTFNDMRSFDALYHNWNRYAAVIIEPMVFDEPKDNFLKHLREWCTSTGTLLIFDEVVTGGRYKHFVAQNHFGIMPDITVLSKGIANGFPLAAVGAKHAVMATFERDDFFASTTFGGECVSLAVCLATLNRLESSIDHMLSLGTGIKGYFNELFKPLGAECKGYPTRLTFDFPTKEHKALFMQEMCLNGVLVGYSNFIMASHTVEDLHEIYKAILNSYEVLKQNWNNPIEAMKGNLPVEVFRLR